MKKILITGANSYIGTSFENYIKENFPGEYIVETIDMIDGSWREKSFSGYDSVFHVAGIAHQKETKKNAHMYYEVNRDLAIETAQKAKADGVKQLVFLSTMSIYGMTTGVITKDTKPNPRSHYGRSKWEAEQQIIPLQDENFKVCILRPPMVYGKGCKGNFVKVKKLVERLPIFPYVKNQRSAIYINNLSSFVRMCVECSLSGVFSPQNREYICTMDMAKSIAKSLNKNVRVEYFSGLAVAALRLFLPVAQRAFGSLVYQDTEDFNYSYIVAESEESIVQSVG